MPALSWLFDALPAPVLYRTLAWQYRLFEPELGRLRKLAGAGGTAIDVGGWWGPWTYWLSRSATTVHTIEPIPHLAQFINRVARPNVTVHNVALSDQPGAAQLWVPTSGKGSEGLSSFSQPSDRDTKAIEVKKIRLDDLELDGVGFVKIDVEGHEQAVLRGAEQTIARSRPRLLIEIEARPERTVEAVFDQVLALGYSGRFLTSRKWRPLAEFDLERDQLREQERVRRQGYVGNLVRRPHYINNFVFDPI